MPSRAFTDRKYNQGDQYPYHYAVNPTYPIYQRMLDMINNLSGKHVLEYGCGEGWITRDLARAGASVKAFDISAEAVTVDKRNPYFGRVHRSV